MSRSKNSRFKEFARFKNTVSYTDADCAKRMRSITAMAEDSVLELAAGTAAYTNALARISPGKVFIALDIQGERLWKGANAALDQGLENAFFFRVDIARVSEFIPPESISEIWITFPDPYPKDRHAKRRLTSALFLKRYAQILRPGGVLHLKTDDLGLFEFSVEQILSVGGRILKEVRDVDSLGVEDPVRSVITLFEQKHRSRGKPIMYLQFVLPSGA